MKKHNLLIATLLVVAAVSVSVVSCKKEKQDQVLNCDVTSVQPADNMNEYLKAFKQRLLSVEKGEETITLEQAQRDLGNLLNFDFGDANYPSNVFHRDTIHIKLIVSEGMVDLSQLAITYKNACEQIADAYEQVNLPEKSVYTIACIIQNEGDVELLLTTRGFELPSRSMQFVNPNKSSIDTNDCWTVFFRRGRCDGTDMGHDHVSILELVYHNNNISLMQCANGTLYYTDVTQSTFKATQYPETGGIYNLGYRLWVGDYMEFHYGTVDYQEMIYYYNNLCDILSNEMASLNDNDFRITNISSTIIRDENDYSRFHFMCKYEFGKPHCTGGGIPVD